jgi:hypothetical protein
MVEILSDKIDCCCSEKIDIRAILVMVLAVKKKVQETKLKPRILS